MTWADRMETASFRGVSFLTDSHDAKGGRRLAIHEYPGAEEPNVEDLGGKSGEFRLNAYFIGADYDLARDKLLATLNTPGADWLRHPWRGMLWVRAHNWSVSESNDKGGYCAISIDFVPGGGNVAVAAIDRADAADSARRKFADAVQAQFDLSPIAAPGMTSLVAAVRVQLDKVRKVISMSALPLALANQARNQVDGLKGDAAVLLAAPASYAAAMRSLSDLLGGGPDVTGMPDTSRPATVARMTSLALAPVEMPAGAVDSSALRINLQREADLRGQLLLAGAAQVALADYRSANDRDAVLATVVAAFDVAMPRMADAVFQAAADCRAALIEALLAQQLDPVQVRDVVHPLPATVLAHRMGLAEDVFAAQNAVQHPLFVQGRVYG